MTRRTDTQPGTRRVLTVSTTAKAGLHLTLVDVHADLHHRRLLVTLSTVTRETSLDVPKFLVIPLFKFAIYRGSDSSTSIVLPALSVTTDTRVDPALVNVQAAVAGLVQGEAWLALALEGVNCVGTSSVLTNVREHSTLIDQLGRISTQTEELLGSLSRTLGAFLTPTSAKGTAASFPAEQALNIIGTKTSPEVQVARLDSVVDTARSWGRP